MPGKMNDVGSRWPSLTSWHISGAAILLAIIGSVVLWHFSRRTTPRGRFAWAAALALSIALLSSDVQATAMVSYRSHMIEHLAAILINAPLVAAGTKVRMSRGSATLGLIAFTVLVPLYHLTRLGALVMEQAGGHLIELLSFIVVGVWFWLPVYGVNRPMTDVQRLTYTFIALPVVVTTGLVLWSSDASAISSVGMNMPMMSIGDIHSGGLVMIEWGSAMMGAHIVGLIFSSALQRRRAFLPVGYNYVDS